MAIQVMVYATFILSTLGLFDFNVVQVPGSNQCRLAETGSSQRQLSKMDATGISEAGEITFSLKRSQDGVDYYMTVDSSDDNRLSFTTDAGNKGNFTSQKITNNLYNVIYEHSDSQLCLQGVFPSVNGTVDYSQAYARVGNCNDHMNIRGNVVLLYAISVSYEQAC